MFCVSKLVTLKERLEMKKYNIVVNGTAYAVEVEEVGGASILAAASAPVAAAPAPAAPAPAPAPAAAPAPEAGCN